MADIWLTNGITGNKSIKPTDINATASAPSRVPLTKRAAKFGIDLGKNEFSNPATDITMFNNYRREDNCRNDLMVRSGRPARQQQLLLASTHGVGRNQNSIFPRNKNNGDILIPVHSGFAARPNKLGIPA